MRTEEIPTGRLIFDKNRGTPIRDTGERSEWIKEKHTCQSLKE